MGAWVSYRYDVFLSYRRIGDWSRFVERSFLPMLTHWLSEELDDPARIFYDRGELQPGGDWPQELAEAIAVSKVMICLWSKQYFTSDWCKAELAHMLARRESVGGTPLAKLVIPVVIHDGQSIPESLGSISRFEIQDYASPYLANDSRTREELSQRLKKLAESVGQALAKAPPFDPAWAGITTRQFDYLFTAKHGQYTVPSLGDAS